MMPAKAELMILADLLNEIAVLAKRLQHERSILSKEPALSAAELNLLQILSQNGPLTVPELARLRSTSRQNIQIQINRLKAAGKVALVPNKAHKRSALVQVRPSGKLAAQTALEQETNFARNLFSSIPMDEAATATAVLRKFRQWLNEHERAKNNGRKKITSNKQQHRELPRDHTAEQSAASIEPENAMPEDSLPVNLL